MTARLTILAAIFCSLSLLAAVPSSVTAQQDRDGDGHVAATDGGDDCDDSDARRFPGNAEIADDDYHDEDCDPTTFGVRDRDGDGFTDAAVCNRDASGTAYCGRDCDDTNAAIHPTQLDVCNNRDDNCNGSRDEDQPCELLGRFQEDPEFTLERMRRETEQRRAMRERAAEDAERAATPIAPEANPRVRLPSQADSRTCFNAVQGRVAWNYRGDTQWGRANVERLCEEAEDSEAPARCFNTVMHEGIDKGDGSTRWRWQDALALCRGARDADATVGCFQDRVDRDASQQQAIKACSGRF